MIQPYIDLWENTTVSPEMRQQSASSPIPKKNRRPVLDPSLPRRSVTVHYQRTETPEMMERKRFNLDGEEQHVVVMRGRVAKDKPPMLQQIKTEFDNWTESSSLRLTPDSLAAEDKEDTTKTLDYASITRGSPLHENKREGGFPSRMDAGESLPFTPDELWNFHRPPETPSRKRPTMRSSSIRNPSGREINPTVSLNHFGDHSQPEDLSAVAEETIPQDTIPAPSRQGRTSPPLLFSGTISSPDFGKEFERLEPYLTSPTAPAICASPRSSQSLQSRSSSRRSKSSSISSTSSNETRTVSAKAAKMLGIDPTTIVSTHAQQQQQGIAEIPDRYNSHRTRSASNPATSLTWITASPWPPAATSSIYPPPLSFAQMIPYDATLDATRIWKALKKSKKPDTDLLSATLVSVSYEPSKVAQLKQKYRELYSESLLAEIKADTSGWYRLALTRLLAGPGESDALAISKNDTSLIYTDDKLVAESLFGKTPEEIHSIKSYFEQLHGISLQTALENAYLTNTHCSGSVFDTFSTPASGTFGRACLRALRADRDVETVELLSMMDTDRLTEREQQLEADVEELYSTKILNQQMLLDLVMRRSDLYLAELCRRFYEVYSCELPELIVAKERTKALSSPLVRRAHTTPPIPPANKLHRATPSPTPSTAPSTSRSGTQSWLKTA